jgi:hypothetical protein
MSNSSNEEDREIQSHFDLGITDLLDRTDATLTEGTAVSHQLGVVAACHAVSSADDPEGPLHVLASIPTAAQPHRFVNTLADRPSGRSISKATYSTLVGSSAGKSFTPGVVFDTGDDTETKTETTHLYIGNIDEYDSKTARALAELMQVGSYSVGSPQNRFESMPHYSVTRHQNMAPGTSMNRSKTNFRERLTSNTPWTLSRQCTICLNNVIQTRYLPANSR